MQITLAKINYLSPPLNSHTTLYMLESFGVTVKLFSQYSATDLRVQIWTNALNKFNSEGNWHGIDLAYQYTEANNILVFQGGFMPTSEGEYQFTYRIGLKDDDSKWRWVGNFQENGYLKIAPPAPEMIWTQGPNFVEFLPHIYVGNFIAASQAQSLGIDAVLNLTSEFTLNFPNDANIAYQQFPLLDGAQHPIPDEVLLKSVRWIDEQLKNGKHKILLHCRAGIGRSGSVSVAYCYYKNPDWSYQQTLDYIWSKKPNVYPHKHLQETLERLFPRN